MPASTLRTPDALPTDGTTGRSVARDIGSLLIEVGRGDRCAFAEVYRLTSARLLGVVLRVNTHRGEAEEVLQDVYVSVWHLAAQFQQIRGDGLAWLVSVARHRAIDSVRLRERRPQQAWCGDAFDETEGPYDALACPAMGPQERCSMASDATALAHCLGALSAPQRHSIILAYYDGLSHSEIAQQLGRPVGSVKGWVRRGLIELRERFDAPRPERRAAPAQSHPS